MEVRTALSEDGEKLFLIIGEDADPEKAQAAQFNIEEARKFLRMFAELIIEAQSVQDMIAMGFYEGDQ